MRKPGLPHDSHADIHHLTPVSDSGPDSPDNLIALCPNCHSLHHKGIIPRESLRAWKMILVALNEAYDRKAIIVLLLLDKMDKLYVQGDALVDCAGLIAGNLVVVGEPFRRTYDIQMTDRGRQLIVAWKSGKQDAAVAAFAVAPVQGPLGQG